MLHLLLALALQPVLLPSPAEVPGQGTPQAEPQQAEPHIEALADVRVRGAVSPGQQLRHRL